MNKVCMISLSYYPGDMRIRREAESLIKKGIAVDILCLRDTDEKKIELLYNVNIYRIMRGKTKEKICKYILFSFHFMIISFLKLLYLSFKNHYNLIQIHNMPDYLMFIPFIQKIFFRTPIIFDMHDLSVELFISKWGERPIVNCIIKYVEKIACKFANAIITTSEGFQESLFNRGIPKEKITIILNSADDRIFQYNKNRSFNKIEISAKLLYHGTVAERFGLSTAIKAVAHLQKKMPGTTLNVFGRYDPSYLKELENLIYSLKLENKVFLNPFIPLEKVSKIIDKSDIGIVPYLSDSFMDLALSTKTFEYVAMGLPVVASRLPSIKSIFDEKCINYFDPFDPEDLAKKILEFCQNIELRKDCVNNSLAVYRDISWPIMAERYHNLIQKMIGGHSSQ